jgi:UDP-2,3-diacylglucosamine hydrolase
MSETSPVPIGLRSAPGPVFFISDAHLGAPAGPPDRERRLLELLSTLPGRAGALFVLGDLFDFWFEYAHAIPKGTFRIGRALAEIVDSGVPVVYLGGNHDFWVGSYLQGELGIRSFQKPIAVRLQGRTILLAHGDGLGPGDGGYKILKGVLRSRWAIGAFRAIHPDLGIPLARRISVVSRKHTEPREVILPRIVRDVVRPRLRGEIDAMLIGHIHEPAHFHEDGKDFLVTGDWIESFTHVRLEEGRFTLYKLERGAQVIVPAEGFPDR